MQKLLSSTALAAALATAAAAQNAIDVPEGFTDLGDSAQLTFDDLNGATVYAADGATLGEISDIVFEAAPMDAAGDDGMNTGMDADADTSAEAGLDTQAETPEAGGESPLANEGDETAVAEDATTINDGADAGADTGADAAGAETADADDPDSTTDDMAAGDVAPDPAADATEGDGGAAAEGEADATEPAVVEEDVMQDGVDTTAQAIDPNSPTDPAVMGQDMAAGMTGDGGTGDVGRVTHVVLDIGGFLGMGGHTVAVPIEALEIYADAGGNLQIFLPWTEDQLRALPAYDEDDPSTLGSMDEMGG